MTFASSGDLIAVVSCTLEEIKKYLDENAKEGDIVGIEMPCEIHTHPLYNDKFETAQQKSVRYTIRVVNSGAFSYGSSNNFGKWYDYKNWNVADNEEYGSGHNLMTGDIRLPSSFGYQKAQNQANSKYPNDSSVALSLKTVTPEPFNLLLVSSIYV